MNNFCFVRGSLAPRLFLRSFRGNGIAASTLHVVRHLIVHLLVWIYYPILTGDGDDLVTGHLGEVTTCFAKRPLNGVKQTVFLTGEPYEVIRSVVINATVEMMTLLPFFRRAMECSADDAADEKGLTTGTDNEVTGMAVRLAFEVLFATGLPVITVGMKNVPFTVCDERMSGVQNRRAMSFECSITHVCKAFDFTAQHMLHFVEKRCKGRGLGISMWGDFFPYLQNLFLFMQKFLYGVLPSVEDSRRNTVWCPELPTERLVVYETDETVMKRGKIARECKKILIGEGLEIALGLLKQELF